CVENYYRGLADARLAATVLALRAYATDHDGKLPASLTALVPGYLPAIPADPFDPAGGPLRYIPGEPDPRLYSLSANGVDDGGSDQSSRGSQHGGHWDRNDAVIHLRRQARDMSAVVDELK